MSSKNKKGKTVDLHAIAIERIIDKRREQEKKIAFKKFKRTMKRLKNERKQNKKTGPSVDYDTNNPESSQHETSDEDSELDEDINLPHSSSSELGASPAIGQRATQQNDKIPKNTIGKDSGRTIGPSVGQRVTQQNDKIPKNTIGKEKLSGNLSATGQDGLKKNPLNYLDDKKLHEGKQVQTQAKAKNKEIADKKSPKPPKSIDFEYNISKNVSQNICRKTNEDFADKRNVLQQKLEALQTDVKSLDEEEKKVVSLGKDKEMAVIGDIKVISTDKSVKNSDKKCSIHSDYSADKRIIHLGDENIEISILNLGDENIKISTLYLGDENIKINILVNQGSQVVCNSRRRQVNDLVKNVNSCPGTLEGHATKRPDEDIKTDSKKHDQVTRGTKCDSSSFSEFSRGTCRAMDAKIKDKQETNTLIESEQHYETASDIKLNSSSIGTTSEENDSSEKTSVREKGRKLCDDFWKDLKSSFEKFERSVMDQI